MPRCLMRCTEISQAAKVCYLALASFAGKGKDTCWPSQETLGEAYGVTGRSARDHVKELEENGFIRSIQNGLNQSNTYEFFSLEDRAEARLGTEESFRSGTTDSSAPGTEESFRSERKNSSVPYLLGTSFIEPLSGRASAGPALFPSPSSPDQTPVGTPHTPENQNPPDFFNPPAVPPPPAPTNVADEERTDVGVEVDLQLDEDILQFVKNCYRQNRGSDLENIEAKSKRDLAEKIRCAEQAHGAIEFRAGLWKFLATGDDWLRQNKWPIRRYLQDPIPYLSGSPRRTRQTHPASASKGASPGQVSSDTPVIVSGADEVIAAWDEINPEYPVGEMTDGTLAKVAKAAASPDFRRFRRKVFEKAGKFLAAGQPMNFQWLFIKKFKDDDPNWMCLLEGKFDFLLHKKSGASAHEDSWARLMKDITPEDVEAWERTKS